MGYGGETVSSRVAARLAGVSYRQLDYWSRLGASHPLHPSSGSGSRRRFGRVDVVRLAKLAAVSKLLGKPTPKLAVLEELVDHGDRWIAHEGTRVSLSVDFGDLQNVVEARWDDHFTQGGR